MSGKHSDSSVVLVQTEPKRDEGICSHSPHALLVVVALLSGFLDRSYKTMTPQHKTNKNPESKDSQLTMYRTHVFVGKLLVYDRQHHKIKSRVDPEGNVRRSQGKAGRS